MRVDAPFNNLKTALYFIAICSGVAAYSQNSQVDVVAKSPEINLQQGSSAVSEMIATEISRKI